jgi:uncharacterized protein YndB with AHSA1/START domain
VRDGSGAAARDVAGGGVEAFEPEPGMVVPLASMDLRVDGKYRIQMKTPDGEFFTAVGVFKEVKAPERLVTRGIGSRTAAERTLARWRESRR